MKYKLTLYSSEKNFKTGKGSTCINFNYDTEEEKKEKINKLQQEQREKNKLFRENLKSKLITDNNMIVQTKSNNIGNPKVKRTLDLKLDKGTGNTTIIIGSSKVGKSCLMMYIFEKYYNKKRYINTLFSNNVHIKTFKKRKNLIKSAGFSEKGEKYIKMEHYINMKCKNKYSFVNYFDDILDLRFNKILNQLVYTYRNAKMSTILNIQYDKLVNKGMRSNINNVICMALNTDEAIEETIKTFLKSSFKKLGLNTLDQMVLFYKKMTKDHGFIYIHPSSQHISYHRLDKRTLDKRRR